jgi:hypothetical protein
VAVARPGETLSAWFQTFRVLQGAEVWACHGDWVTAAKPVFGPGINERFQVYMRRLCFLSCLVRSSRVSSCDGNPARLPSLDPPSPADGE